MAVFTPLNAAEADRVCQAHGLGACLGIQPIPQGSVNSNFFVDTPGRRYFLRIYEEQQASGVAYEWAVLDHLQQAGIPVPRRVGDVQPGAVCVAGKPVAIFEVIGGEASCQAGVTLERARAVGQVLGEVHRAGASFAWIKEGRFELDHVVRRLDAIDMATHPELVDVAQELRDAVTEIGQCWPTDLPRGLIHGDLFRDNVFWEGDRIIALIDWESASHGLLAFDLMVTILAWCYGDHLRWDLAAELAHAYARTRPLEAAERHGLRVLGMAAATRFTITRITDFHLRRGIGERVHKDYRRFLQRLRDLRSLSADEVAARLLGG